SAVSTVSMPPPGRSSAARRSSSIAWPKWRKRPPLQVPMAARPRSLTGAARSGLGIVVRRGVVPVGPVLAVALLGADPDRLRLRLLRRFRLRLLRRDDLQAQR